VRLNTVFLVACLFVLAVPATAQDPDQEPAKIGLIEKEDVALVLVETLVTDAGGRTVPGLVEADFQLSVNGQVTQLEALDVSCPGGALDDALPVGFKDQRPAAEDVSRRIVLVFDFVHLSTRDRNRVAEFAREMMGKDKTPKEQIMVASIAEGLRIEQGFTADSQEIIDALERMQYDVTLFAKDYRSVTSEQYMSSLSTLMDILAQYDQAKAVVLYSSLLSRANIYDDWYREVAQRAAAARSVIYPGFVNWYESPDPRRGQQRPKGDTKGQQVLPRLAVESGGRMPPRTDDLSLSYAMAQRDLTCRYTLSYNIERKESLVTQDVHVTIVRQGLKTHYPSRIRLWTEEEQRQSRVTAAFAEPKQYELPVVRGFVYPYRPNGSSWDVLAALSLPMPVGPDGTKLNLDATLARGNSKAQQTQREFKVPPRKDGQHGSQPVALFGDTTLKPGDYTWTVVLSSPKIAEVATTTVQIEIPKVPKGETFIRGPILARVIPEGVLLRADEGQQSDTALDKILGEDRTFEPLMVHEIKAADALLLAWDACTGDKGVQAAEAVVERKIVDKYGSPVHSLEPVTLTLEGEGKVTCHGKLDHLPEGTLKAGEYLVEIAVMDKSSGKREAFKSVPLHVE
jgi:VWFA-related protein